MWELGAVSAATNAVARLLGLSKTARLKASIRAYTKMHAEMRSQQGLEQSAKQLSALIEFQTNNLVAREAIALTRIYDWGSLAGAILCAGIVGSPIYWLISLEHWWALAIAGLLAFIALLFVVAGVSTVRKTPDISDLSPTASPDPAVTPSNGVVPPSESISG